MSIRPSLKLILKFALLPLAGSLCSGQAHPAGAAATPPAQAAAPLQFQLVVKNKKGDPVPGLTAADFTLTDNTHPQTMQQFAPDPNRPQTIGLLFETSDGMRQSLSEEQKSAETFGGNMLAISGNRAFVIQFNKQVDLLEDVSSSKDKLHAALQQVGTAEFGGDTNGGEATAPERGRRGTTAGANLYDAIFLASDDVLKTQKGFKTLVVLTDGIDRGSKETLNGAIEAAQRAGVTVYAIYFKAAQNNGNENQNRRGLGRPGGVGFPGGGGGWPGGGYPGGGGNAPTQPSGGDTPTEGPHVDGRKILEEICSKTGGYMYDSSRARLDELFTHIGGELHDAYVLSYTPPAAEQKETGFHHLVLTPKAKNQFVQMTEGYYVADE